jgi:hypothetical protein
MLNVQLSKFGMSDTHSGIIEKHYSWARAIFSPVDSHEE